MRFARTGFFAALLLVTASAAHAQVTRSETSGFLVNLHLNGSAAKYEDVDGTESGGGLGLALGYGITRNILLFVNVDAAALDFEELDIVEGGSYGLLHLDFGGRVSFRGQEKKLIPYVEGALTGLGLGSETEYTDGTTTVTGELGAGGTGLTLGGGFEYFFDPSLSLDVSLKSTFGKLDEWEFDGEPLDVGEMNVRTTRINIGLSWRPFK